MRTVCHRICGDAGTADDAFQLALIAAWRGMARFDGRARLSTWLYRIVHNASVGLLRSERRHAAVPLDDRVPAPGSFGRDPAGSVVDVQAVQWALARIPVDFRAAVVLRDLCGCSYQEVATIQDVRVETAKTRIARGRQALSALLVPSTAGAGGGQ